jgi:hypothetical protein
MSVLSSPVMVPAGSRMVWSGQFSGWSSVDYSEFIGGSDFGLVANVAISAVQTSLSQNYSLIVEKSNSTQDGGITLSLRTDIDRGDGIKDDGLTDIQGNVNDAFSLADLPVSTSGIGKYSPTGTDSTTGTAPPTTSPSLFNSFMADTAGVVFRAATGNVDPWTKANIVSEATRAYIQAGADPSKAALQAQKDVTNVLKDFTLGGTDKVGADPSQAKISIPSATSLFDAVPGWALWAGGGVILLGVLFILAPYVKIATRE